MTKVITYGTYDYLHYGHIRLLERAKALGDYLIVGVTADDFDKTRGKINVQQSLMERIEAVRQTGLADEIIVEEYEGQKIDDIRRLDIDIFTVGSDWKGKFDYLNEFCKVVYLDRTEGVSSSDIRSHKSEVKFGLVGESSILNKLANESKAVNGITVTAVYTHNDSDLSPELKELSREIDSFEELLAGVDAVYIASRPDKHYRHIKRALEKGVHVLCESPISLSVNEVEELFALAKDRKCVLMEGIKTAYSTAFSRLILLVKSGRIGEVVSVDATCTSLRDVNKDSDYTWNSICAWGPTAMLPVFQILGTDYVDKHIVSRLSKENPQMDEFTKIDFVYPHAVASVKVGKGVKSEGELIISGTKGYVYVPAPWWKTDYFEIRYENPADNKRYFYQLDGEGIRYEIVSFLSVVNQKDKTLMIPRNYSKSISEIIELFIKKKTINVI
jgi:choline-phosphate cytidylyltransferase